MGQGRALHLGTALGPGERLLMYQKELFLELFGVVN